MAAIWASLLLPCLAQAACRVDARATIPITQAGGLLLVPVELNGISVRFILDTGAERTVVGLGAADQLHLARDEWVSTDILGTGGRDRRRLGRPASLALGGIALRRRTVAADNSVVVGPIPDAIAGQPVAGLLGQDFLSPFDLDLDVPGGRLTLYSVSDCAGRFLPWPGAYRAVPAWRPVRNILAVPVHFGATAMAAELDSGADVSTITLPGMVQMGLREGGPLNIRGFGPGQQAGSVQTFAHVAVGDLPAKQAAWHVAPIQTMRSIGALLGADWLAGQRVWISWATDQVFVAQGLARPDAPAGGAP